MKSNWEEITIGVLAEHVGALAYIIVDDARAKVKSPIAQPALFTPEFILRVGQELPTSVNRSHITAQLRAALK